jgi:hypothetical protein
MNRFVPCEERTQDTFLPSRLEDYVTDDNPVRVIDVFVGALDLTKLGFEGMTPQATGRPGYHPSTLLKIYLYGYLNRIQSSRRLERETQRNVERMWLTGPIDAGLQDDCQFPQGQRPGDPRCVLTVHRALPSTAVLAGGGCGGWQQVQGGE